MTCTVRREHCLHHIRSWTLAFAAIAGWLLLVSNVAEAQQIQVPEAVLAQVLGPNAARDARPAPVPPVADPGVALVAVAMRDRFEGQLVAGDARPSVELEVHFDSVDIDDESGSQIEATAAEEPDAQRRRVELQILRGAGRTLLTARD